MSTFLNAGFVVEILDLDEEVLQVLLDDGGGLGIDQGASVLHRLHEDRHEAVQIAEIGGNTLAREIYKTTNCHGIHLPGDS